MRRVGARSVQGLVLFTCSACAWACASGPRATDTLASSFASAEAQHAKPLAPDLYARAQDARQHARDAQDADARADYEMMARLWLEAAQHEAARIELERARRAQDARAEAAAMARAVADRERLAIEAELQREEAAKVARAEAERVYAQAALDEEQPRKQSATRDAARAEAARFLAARARLTLETAVALGLSEEHAREATEAVERAEADLRAVSGTSTSAANTSVSAKIAAQLESAQSALAGAERALGRARAARGAPNAEQAASLLEMARERGLAASVLERGLAIDARELFAGGGVKLSAKGRALAQHVAALMRAFPQGPVTFELLPRDGKAARAKAEAQGKALSAAVVTEATAGASADEAAGHAARVRVADASDAVPAAGTALIVFGGYGPSVGVPNIDAR